MAFIALFFFNIDLDLLLRGIQASATGRPLGGEAVKQRDPPFGRCLRSKIRLSFFPVCFLSWRSCVGVSDCEEHR